MAENGKEKNPEMDDVPTSAKMLRITFHVPESLESKFVNNVVVTHSPQGEFYVSFFEVVPPAIVGETEEEKRRAIAEIETVQARCVARVVMTEERMAATIGAFAENLRSYTAKRGAEKKPQPEGEAKKHAG